jgi:hypothetical protein
VIHLNQGNKGFGGPGRGRGGKAPESETNVRFKNEKLKGRASGKGRITGVMYVKGLGKKGEATREYTSAVETFRKSQEESLENDNIPIERRALVRDYFDRIQPAPGESNGSEKK